jgi:hypothetical protein
MRRHRLGLWNKDRAGRNAEYSIAQHSMAECQPPSPSTREERGRLKSQPEPPAPPKFCANDDDDSAKYSSFHWHEHQADKDSAGKGNSLAPWIPTYVCFCTYIDS